MTLRAVSWSFLNSGVAVFSSSVSSSDFSFATSKIPPERSEAALQALGVEGLHISDDGLCLVHGSGSHTMAAAQGKIRA
jgi:hypothetical protein